MTAYPDEHWAAVAEVYIEARDERLRPNVAIADTWNVPLSTAQRWTREARRRGLLGPYGPICRGRCPACCSS